LNPAFKVRDWRWSNVYWYPRVRLSIRRLLTKFECGSQPYGRLGELDSPESNRHGRLSYLQGYANQAIYVTRTSLHHGMANMMGQRSHRKRQPQNTYRREMLSALTADALDSLGDFAQSAAAAVVTKAGMCDDTAAVVLMWLIKVGIRCRITYCSNPAARHTFLILSLPGTHLIVDAWVNRPALCFPDECEYFRLDLSDVCNCFVFDVVGTNPHAMVDAINTAKRQRADIKEDIADLKGLTGRPENLFDDDTNIRASATRQCGVNLDGALDYVPLPPRDAMQGRGIQDQYFLENYQWQLPR
jgi:hypothetical protein